MAYLNNEYVTVDAVLTTKGRELLARNDGSFRITQFALSDDEIDYTLYNPNHPSGSAYYGEAIEAMPLLQAFVDNTQDMKYQLVTIPKSLLLVPKIPSIAVVGLLAAQFLILQSIGGTEPKCTLNVERPHYSTSLSENQNIDAIKLNITSICNVSQKYTQLSASIQKIKNNREITAYSFVNERRSSTTKSPNVASFKELFGPCQKGVSAAYRGTAQGYVYLENGKKLAVKGDSGKFVAAGCLIGAQ
jgi:hypothetical protein